MFRSLAKLTRPKTSAVADTAPSQPCSPLDEAARRYRQSEEIAALGETIALEDGVFPDRGGADDLLVAAEALGMLHADQPHAEDELAPPEADDDVSAVA